MPKTNFSEINPLESLSKVIGPLDGLWKALGSKLNIGDDGDNLSGLLKSGPESRSNLQDTLRNLSTQETLGMVKKTIVLVANIFVAILEIVLSIVKGILALIV